MSYFISAAAMELMVALFFLSKKDEFNDHAIVYFTDRFNPVWN